jgi:integrase
MATYQHRADRNCWIARVYDPSTGRERTRTFGHGIPDTRAGRRQADEASHAVIAELQATVADNVANRGTVKEYAEKWIARRRAHLSPTTTSGGYDVMVRRIVRKFGRRRLTDLTRAEIRDWYDELRTQAKPRLSEATVEKHHQVLRAILYDAVDNEVLARNPAAKMKRPQRQREELALPSAASVLNASQAIGGDFGNFFRLLVLTGMRRGELCGLAWGDIEPVGDGRAVLHVRRSALDTRGGVTIGPTKSKRTRKVPIEMTALEVLDAQLRSVRTQLEGRDPSPSSPVFPDVRRDHSGHTPHRPGWASEWWRRHRAEYGMEGVRLHDLRHHHATSLLDDGVPLNTVSARLGHSKASTTSDIYGHGTDTGDELAVVASGKLALPLRATET